MAPIQGIDADVAVMNVRRIIRLKFSNIDCGKNRKIIWPVLLIEAPGCAGNVGKSYTGFLWRLYGLVIGESVGGCGVHSSVG